MSTAIPYKKESKATKSLGARLRQWLLYGLGVPLLNLLDKMVARSSLVGNSAILDNNTFEWSKKLEENWHLICDDLIAINRDKIEIPNIQEIASDLSHLTTDDGWKSFIFFAYGYKSEVNCQRCPNTTRLLEEIPGITNAVFSVLSPGKHIPRHRGEYKGIIRCHLGLVVPEQKEQCRMQIKDQTVVWEEGKLVIFDNSYHHEVWNDTDQTRIILMFDVVRPLRWPWSWVNRGVLYLISKSPYVQSAQKNQKAWDRGSTSV